MRLAVAGCMLCIFLASTLRSGMACGHHGRVAHDTHRMASLHLKHKELLNNIAHAHGLQTGIEANEISQLQSLRRSMQSATAQQAPLLDNLHQLLTARSIMTDSNDPVGGQGSVQQVHAPVRLHVEYQDDASQNSAHATLVSVTSTVVRVLQSYLSVRVPTPGPLLISPMCYQHGSDNQSCLSYYPAFDSSSPPTCGQATINTAHILDPESCNVTGSSNCHSMAGKISTTYADMVLYVTSVQDAQCNSGAAAWAMPCMFDLVTNRPVMGTANVCPFSLTTSDPDALVAIMTHEVLHALGFTNTLFGSYIDPTTNQLLPNTSVVATASVNGKEVTRVITPSVTREARAQFGCDALDGAQLEDEGGSGSQNAHWEYTHYQGDLMMASTQFSAAGEPPRISRLTLALMEDTGWYLANWTQAGGSLPWGQGTGCVLPQQGCQKFMAVASPITNQNMFCDSVASAAQGAHLRQIASPSHRSTGYCRGQEQLPFADGCGMVVAKEGGVPSCSVASLQYVNPEVYGWWHGTQSRAYPVTYMFEVALNDGRGSVMYFPATGQAGDKDAVCYPSSCQNGQVFIKVNSQQIRCPTGAYLSLPAWLPGTFLNGIIGPCPDEEQVCRTLGCAPGSCHPQGGTCNDGICTCRLGWTALDCSFSLLRNTLVPFPLDPTQTGGVGGKSGSPPPPTMINVTTWVQQVAFTCELNGTTLQAAGANIKAFQAALASWGNLDVSQTQVVNLTLVSAGTNTGAMSLEQQTKTQGVSRDTPKALPMQQQGGQEWELESGLRQDDVKIEVKRRLVSTEEIQSTVDAPDTSIKASRWFARARANLRAVGQALKGVLRRRGLGETLITPINVQVTTIIRPSSTLQTSLLMNRFSDSEQLLMLTEQELSAGFTIVPGTIKATLRIVQETITVPNNTPTADERISKSQDDVNGSMDRGKQLTWKTVITVVSIGAGCMVIMAIVLGVACARSRAVHVEIAKEQQQRPVSMVLINQPHGHPHTPNRRPNSRPGSPIVLPPHMQQPQGAKIAPEWSFGGGNGAQTPPWGERQTPVAMGWPPHLHLAPGAVVSVAGLAPHLMDINPVYSSPMRRGS